MKTEKQKASKRAWELANPEMVKAQRKRSYCRNAEKRLTGSAKWRIENPEKYKNNMLKAKFGISIDSYNAMLESQGGKCAICKNPETTVDARSKKVRSLSVDHDHISGLIRSLLCGKCNRALGYLQDSSTIADAAVQYLRKFNR